jgi:hypothetical protein
MLASCAAPISSRSVCISLLDENSRRRSQHRNFGKDRQQRGPYLISGNWWDEKSWARAEWDLQWKMANWFVSRKEGTWKIDGIYD